MECDFITKLKDNERHGMVAYILFPNGTNLDTAPPKEYHQYYQNGDFSSIEI